MDASRILASRISSAFPSEQDQSKDSTRTAEAAIYTVCAAAGVSCIGITRDLVIFQPHIASLSIPLTEFQDAAKAIALIRAKLAEVGR
jgi:hypothetical protein